MHTLSLAYNLSFEDLYTHEGLQKLDTAFINHLKNNEEDLHNRLVTARLNPNSLSEKEFSNLCTELAPIVEEVITKLFNIDEEVKELQYRHNRLAPLYSCKRLFVQRRALKKIKPKDVESVDGIAMEKDLETLFSEPFSERSFATHITNWLEEEEAQKEHLNLAATYAAWAAHTEEGRKRNHAGILFKTPKKLDPDNLVPVETVVKDGVTVLKLPDHHCRRREGFALTDAGADLQKALDETNYCIFCHNQGRDSCSKGLKEKDGTYKVNNAKITLAGCPLEEHISEMNALKSQGFSIAALAAITINNPMCAGTGHRICNDCMKSCIYQKQDPVNIPQAETRSLSDVLSLPWGFEIYSLLTRWNPLNLQRPIMKKDSGYKILVSGLGPAGYTLSHHLLAEGHTVVAIDGLKIEPLPSDISGITPTGEHVDFTPIKNIEVLFESLDERVLAGFGGVAEYGITVRWNKNYLKILRLLLERQRHFRMFGGIRFGGTITYESAFELGFDHIALAMGAGKPRIVDMPNRLVPGVRTASDFLMALQLTGAAKKDSVANLQLRLPAIVIGGGLTGIDTATESLAYYPVQVEKFLTRYETLIKEQGEEAVRASWTKQEAIIADEFITHAQAIRKERQDALNESREPDILSLLNSWGGVTLAYRKRLVDSPSYRLNHEEVELAMQEGIHFMENATPKEVLLDEFGHAKGLRVACWEEINGGETQERDKILSAKSILMAAGTSPNTVLHREDPKNFELDGKYFKAIDESGNHVSPEWLAKPSVPQVLMSLNENAKAVSFFGDLHPSFAGNVVKAMGSAKQGYPIVNRILEKAKPTSNKSSQAFLKEINTSLCATVKEVIRLTSNIVEIVIHAPLAAKTFEPGQFYRLQNFETLAIKVRDEQGNNTTLAMEGLALTGAWADKEKGLLSTIVLEMGGSSDLCAHLKVGEPVILMGPTGTPTEIPQNETVMLVGGGLGNAVLFSIGKAMKAAGSKVLYFAGYKKLQDRYKTQDIEAASDVIVWCCDEGEFTPNRDQDHTFHGNIVQAMLAYAEGKLGETHIDTKNVDRIIAIGSDRMMRAVAESRHSVLQPYLNPKHEAIGSINSPMQCMMKEICAQCLQKHIDKETGEVYYVFSCFNQDQPLDRVDFQHLNARLSQNAVQEKLTAKWIDRALKQLHLRKQVA